jgi:hypothetical protein
VSAEPAPRAEPTPARAPIAPVNAQADLVRRYARMLRTASASAAARRNAGRLPDPAPGVRFTRPPGRTARTDDA